MEENMVHFTLWNYNPINDNVFGDHWNGEDFSIFTSSQSPPSNKLEDINPSQMSSSEESIAESPSKRSPVLRKTKSFGAHLLVNTSGAKTIDGISMSRTRGSSPNPITPKSLFDLNEFFDNPAETPFCEHHEGGRALDAVVRPYATKISGIPRRMRFDYKTRDFFLSFAEAPANAGSQDSKNLHRTTELFIPSYQYGGQEVCVTVSDGTFKYDTRNQSLYWVYDPSAKPRSTNEAHIFGDESIVRTMWRILGLLLSWILSLFFGIYFNGADRPDGGEALHWIHVSPVTKIPKRRHFFWAALCGIA